MKRSVNKVILVGNLTRDPELRYTPQGTAVASFVVATNREWKVEGEVKEAADFHNIVAWNKLGELCAQLLTKGSKVYVEGRLQTRNWEDGTGSKRYKTEVVIDQMILLNAKNSDDDDTVTEDDDSMEMADQDVDLDKVLDDLAQESDN